MSQDNPVKAAGPVNSQSNWSVPHLSSHSIRYSCPATTAISETADPNPQSSSLLANSVNVSQPSVYTYNLVSEVVPQELTLINPSSAGV